MKYRWLLFPKYATLIISLVAGMLVASSVFSILFSYRETQEHLATLQNEKAGGAAARIEQYILDIERQIGWTALPGGDDDRDRMERRRIEYLKLLRQVPAITEVAWIDASGREQLHVSRLTMDRQRSGIDLSRQEKFVQASAGKTHYGTVHFLKDTEPYMTISRPAQGGGVTAAEVNLKFVWDVVSRIKVGKAGLAYVVDAGGSLIAHPDISLVLKKSNLMTLPQVSTMSKEPGASIGRDRFDQEVLSAHAPIPTLNWMVFVETPRSEMFEALYAPMLRAALLLIAGLVISIVAAYLLVRALVRPLLALQEGAARIGAGEFDRRIEMNTGDELDDLAGQFNQMGADLKASYAGLERKVAERTLELQHEQLRTKELLHNILPVEIAEELSATGGARSARHESVTILFTDFSGFTQAVSTMPADRMVAELNEIFAAFDDITDECGVEKIKTIGDAYMAAAGLPRPCADHGQRCIRAGLRMVAYLEHRNRSAAFKWSIRVGVHSGPVVAGVVGKRKYAFDIWGDTVNVASRMESAGEVGRVNISAYTYDLIQKDFECEYRGKVSAKGKGEIDMYFVKEPRSD